MNNEADYFEKSLSLKPWSISRHRFIFVRQCCKIQDKVRLQLDLFVPHDFNYQYKEAVVTNESIECGRCNRLSRRTRQLEGTVCRTQITMPQKKALIKQEKEGPAPVRRISNLAVKALLETAEQMAKDNPKKHERTLFIIEALYGMYLRISEIVVDDNYHPTMGDFRKGEEDDWWFHVVGKGNKPRQIAVSEDVLKALLRYRTSRGLSPYPIPGEKTELLISQRGETDPITSTRRVRGIVQTVLDKALIDIPKKKGSKASDGAALRAATAHWLRHTGISEDVKVRERDHVREEAGHQTGATTDRYTHSGLEDRFKSSKLRSSRHK